VEQGEVKPAKNGRQGLTIFLILLVAVPLILLLLKEKDTKFVTPLQLGQPAPDFTFPDLDGRELSLSDYRGKVVLVNIWATWCPPCRDEMPSMQKLYEKFKGRGFEILAVSIDADGREAVAPFMEQMNLTFPALLDPNEKVRSLYAITGVPESFIIDKNGILVDRVIGPLDWASQKVFIFLENLLQKSGP
jgi:cytochrome c biogenesis protein CcmG/thiol:disulfide interchange protein DsbE